MMERVPQENEKSSVPATYATPPAPCTAKCDAIPKAHSGKPWTECDSKHVEPSQPRKRCKPQPAQGNCAPALRMRPNADRNRHLKPNAVGATGAGIYTTAIVTAPTQFTSQYSKASTRTVGTSDRHRAETQSVQRWSSTCADTSVRLLPAMFTLPAKA